LSVNESLRDIKALQKMGSALGPTARGKPQEMPMARGQLGHGYKSFYPQRRRALAGTIAPHNRAARAATARSKKSGQICPPSCARSWSPVPTFRWTGRWTPAPIISATARDGIIARAAQEVEDMKFAHDERKHQRYDAPSRC
jgi:hypothetical protein